MMLKCKLSATNILLHNLSSQKYDFEQLINLLKDKGFIISVEKQHFIFDDLIIYYIYLHDLSDLDRLMKIVQRQIIIVPKVYKYKDDSYDYELEIYNDWRE